MSFISDLIDMFSRGAEGTAGAGKNPFEGAMSVPVQTPMAQATRAPMFTPGGTQKRGGPQAVPKDEDGLQSVINRIMAGGSTDELMGVQPAAATGTPMQYAMQPNPTDQRLAAGTQQTPMAPQAVPQQGLLSRIGFENGNQALGAFGAALAAAGSPDPVKAALAIQQQRSEEAKNKAELAQKNKPKYTPFGPGTVMVEYQGRVDFMPVEQARAFALQMEGVKATNSQERALAVAAETERLKAKAAADKSALEAVPELAANRSNLVELRSIAGELGSLDADKKFLPSKKADSLTGFVAGNVAALPLGAGEALNGEAVDLRQRAQKVVQGGLRAVLGGQYTQAEGESFLARAYNPRLNPEANFRSLQRAADELETLLGDKEGAQAYYQKNRTLAGFVPGSATPSAAPAPAGAVPSEFQQYLRKK